MLTYADTLAGLSLADAANDKLSDFVSLALSTSPPSLLHSLTPSSLPLSFLSRSLARSLAIYLFLSLSLSLYLSLSLSRLAGLGSSIHYSQVLHLPDGQVRRIRNH
jgi:hypothetical protein